MQIIYPQYTLANSLTHVLTTVLRSTHGCEFMYQSEKHTQKVYFMLLQELIFYSRSKHNVPINIARRQMMAVVYTIHKHYNHNVPLHCHSQQNS